MRSWIFTGISDKRDLLLYLSRLLAVSGLRVLLVDATERQTYRYSISKLDKHIPVTEFYGFEVADGFFSDEGLREYLEQQGTDIKSYDIVIYDLEKLSFGSTEIWLEAESVWWVSSMDRFEVERSTEWFARLLQMYPKLQGIFIRTVFLHHLDCRISPEYVQMLASGLPVKWSEEPLTIATDELAYAAKIENGHDRAISLRRLTRTYKKSISQLVVQVAGWKGAQAKRALKLAERRKA
ncbi:hypothetical protein DCC85_11945 [Paenibacillus sp. CAA11]|nr:hypothetical protein DCC85_11945 [Paenibacillus sp. CAA11]